MFEFSWSFLHLEARKSCFLQFFRLQRLSLHRFKIYPEGIKIIWFCILIKKLFNNFLLFFFLDTISIYSSEKSDDTTLRAAATDITANIVDTNNERVLDARQYEYYSPLDNKSQIRDLTAIRTPSRGRPRGNYIPRKRQPTDLYGCPYCSCTRNYSHNLYSHIRSKHRGQHVYCIDYQANDQANIPPKNQNDTQ